MDKQETILDPYHSDLDKVIKKHNILQRTLNSLRNDGKSCPYMSCIYKQDETGTTFTIHTTESDSYYIENLIESAIDGLDCTLENIKGEIAEAIDEQ